MMKNKHILIFALILLAGCGEIPSQIGQTFNLHKHYSVITNSAYEIDSYYYLKEKDSTELSVVEENSKHFIVVNITITHDRTEEDYHVLDKDDFRLLDSSRMFANNLGEIVLDYKWLDYKFEKESFYTFDVAFSVYNSIRLETNPYLEIDFLNTPLNSTRIRLN